MPDLLTHVMTGYGVQKVSGRFSYWLVVGVILPDILTRPFTIIWPQTYWWTMPFHTPLGLLLICGAVSLGHSARHRTSVFVNLALGSSIHVLLDVFQAHLAGSYHLLFPFSWRSFEVPLIWPETTLYLLPVWIAVGLWMLWRRLVRLHPIAE